jgi:hypothetical protein
VTLSFDATTRILMNSHKQVHPGVLCACGARLEAAAKHRADLIVMTTHGEAGSSA